MTKLDELIAAAKTTEPTPQEKEEQRRSFAYGNTRIGNPLITRESIDHEAEALRAQSKWMLLNLRTPVVR